MARVQRVWQKIWTFRMRKVRLCLISTMKKFPSLGVSPSTAGLRLILVGGYDLSMGLGVALICGNWHGEKKMSLTLRLQPWKLPKRNGLTVDCDALSRIRQ